MDFLQVIENGTCEECERALAKRLELNSSFFKKHYKKVYPLLTREPSNYQLYVGEDGINIYNLVNKNFVYPKKEGKHTFVDISKQFATNPLNNPLWRLSNNDIYINKMEIEKFEQSGAIQNRVVEMGLRNEDLHKGILHLPSNMLPVTSLFGLGGGLYLEYLQNSFEYIHSLLVFEESYDFFRISCCFVDYPALFKRMGSESLYFFVEDIIDRKLIKSFFTKRRLTSNYIRLELTLYSTPKIEEVKKIVRLEQYSNSRGWGTYEDEMIGVRNSKRNMSIKDGKLKYPTLAHPKKLNYPICVVGNGTSLDDLIPFLQKNKNSMIIISCGTALKPLRNNGIKPDFQLEIERLPFLKKILKDSEIEDIPIIGANIVDSSTLEASKEAYVFMRGSSAPTYLKKPKFTLEHSYPFVGNAGLAFALEFASPIYLVGLDMGYKKGRSKHAKNSFYGDEDNLLPKDAVETKGNLSDDIYSTPLFSLSREMA
ncbi:MAG: 6-hydroxymethylpterin diphosphokinase MptE-like protein [Campylobacterales bacterium]